MTLGDIIKNYRTMHELSMDAFSERSGISKAYISLLEKNKHPKTGKEIAPSIQCIRQAARGMRMDFDELFSLLDSKVDIEDISFPAAPTSLPPIMDFYNQLNDAGKAEATKRVEELTYFPRYKDEMPNFNDIPETLEEAELESIKHTVNSNVG